jgi:hypothetical protein
VNVDFAFLCDYADTGRKLAAFGIGIDTIYSPNVPAVHPLFYVVISLRFSMVEGGQKQIGVRVIDADGREIVPSLDTTVTIAPPLPGYTYRVQRIALALYGVSFPRYGDYSVRWLVNGTEVQSVPLKVAPPPPTRPTA